MKRKHLSALVAAALMTFAAGNIAAETAQTTGFTYQGQLDASGTLGTGSYQFTFTLYNAATGGTVVGAPLQQQIDVINGVFTTDLDFGLIFNGTQYWLEIKVGSTVGSEQVLSERQPINVVPVAQYALNSPPGARGPQGPQGVQGPLGMQGATGGAGAQGVAGPQGSQGVDGTQGAPGAMGSQGPIGPQGLVGTQGFQGPSGATGNTGLAWQGTWSPMAYSPNDAVFDNGSSYIAVNATAANDEPATSVSGNWQVLTQQGAVGATGVAGTPGVQGLQGTQGSQGAVGSQGASGATGLQGPQGTQGAAGSQGAAGAQGAAGSVGVQGAVGPQGAAGSAGAKGSTGATGTNGTNGATGTTGAAGATGNAGTTGATGITGNTGPRGATGIAGPQGPTGLQGAPGLQGEEGDNGAKGATGAAGATGAQGATGSFGAVFQTGGASGATLSTSSAAYVTTSGSVGALSANVTVPPSGNVVVILTGGVDPGSSVAYMGFVATGANTRTCNPVAPCDSQALARGGTTFVQDSAVYFVSGLNAGATTFTLAYRSAGGTATFINRNIVVIPAP